MKTTERYIGLVLEHSQVTAVELVHSPKGFALTAAGSFMSQFDFDNQTLFGQPGGPQREKLFAQELLSFFKKIGASSKLFAFGLNTKMVMLQTIPIDATLSDGEFEQHVQWELKQYFKDPSPHSYTISSFAVEDAQQHVASTALIAVRKSFVNFLSRVATLCQAGLNIIDIDHFGAENALLHNHPDIASKRAILIGVDEDSFDVSTLIESRTKGITVLLRSGDTDLDKLVAYADSAKPDEIYLHGRLATELLMESMKARFTAPVAFVDPFKNVTLPQTLRNHDEVAEQRISYASAIGLALRTE